MTDQKVKLKDILFNRTKVEQIAYEITRVYPAFKTKEFVSDAITKFPVLELKARISWIAECLKKYLPSEYNRAVNILLKALPSPNSPDLSDDDFGDFIYAPYSEYVAKNGCTKHHLLYSLAALHKITQCFSVEDAIRYFINAFPNETLSELDKWTADPHYHVRRLCSEGTRPKLPWAQKIDIPVTAPLTLLNKLYYDKTRFVTRSVANHLNDISKTNPDLVIETLVKWSASGKQKPTEMAYIINHGLRTLIKQGNQKALHLLGFSSVQDLSVIDFTVPKHVKMNESLEFSCTLQVQEDTEIIVDYILYFQNKSGKLNSKKVFKLKKVSLIKNQSFTISKRHPFRQFMTTRTLYTGVHEIELQINGKSFAKTSFNVV
jgi:3-methyladenine DNA glycosylase AlkC